MRSCGVVSVMGASSHICAANCDFGPRFVKPGIETRSARLQCPPPGRFRPVPPMRGICPCHAPPGFMPIVPEFSAKFFGCLLRRGRRGLIDKRRNPSRHGIAQAPGSVEPRLDHAAQIDPEPAHRASHSTVSPLRTSYAHCRLPMWSEPWFRSSGHAVAEPGDAFGPAAGPFLARLPAPCKKRPFQALAHGRVNDVSKCVRPSSLNPSVPVVK